ncbi:Bacitracin synthetase 1 (BA1) [Thermobacillus xylanilyticus]|uniref:Bacitracin synthetase 1 (BA1) n=2 Tax=Thermobacillus xylanilyticus TaxID=76633 RepID=A0ABN7S0V5_THEXY|nr:Bacitracin synthetase 1 (BA1) [Thermobacillus xylanilyticus]
MNYVTIGPEDRLLQLSNYAFDGSVFDIFGALLNGAGLVLVNRWTVLEIDELGKLIEEKGVTVFFVTTSLFNLLVDGALPRLRKVRRILFGGEAASVRHARKALNALGPGRLINVYGPTETTVFATYYPICEIPADAPSVPIGKAISNTTLYVLDQQGQPVPPGVPGELFIGGDGVGSGYLNRDDLTRDKFVVLPVAPGERLYRTGDLVRYLPTGDLDYIGRLDFQVKIRGFRIELGEIEARILQLPGVREAAVVARRDQSGSLYLAAFYSGETPDAPLPDDIRRMLADMLPEYMVPARIVKLDQLPLNRNGKIDRQSLPADTEAASPGEDGRLCPTTPPSGMDAEEIILSKMREVLDDPRFGRQDNFFRHGGHSIKAIALVQALAKEGIFLKVNEVFRYPTAAELAVLPSVAGSRQAPSNEPDAFGTVPQTVADLEDGQIEALIRQVQASCAAVGDLIRSAQVKSEFPLSPVQRAHRAAKSRISGFTAVIRGFLNQRQMQKLLADVILEHQLLHSVMEDNEPLETRWREMDLSGLEGWLAQQLPYADLSITRGKCEGTRRQAHVRSPVAAAARSGRPPVAARLPANCPRPSSGHMGL